MGARIHEHGPFPAAGGATRLDEFAWPLPQPLAETMHAAWVAFARQGDPGWTGCGPEGRATMRFDLESGVVGDPLAGARALRAGARWVRESPGGVCSPQGGRLSRVPAAPG